MEETNDTRELVLRKLSNGNSIKYREYERLLPGSFFSSHEEAESILNYEFRDLGDDIYVTIIDTRVRRWLDEHPIFVYKDYDTPSLPPSFACELIDQIGMNVIIKMEPRHIIESNADRPQKAKKQFLCHVSRVMYCRQLERYLGEGLDSHYAGIVIKGSYLKFPKDELLSECIEYDICNERLSKEGCLQGILYEEYSYLDMSEADDKLAALLKKHASDPYDPKYIYAKSILKTRAEYEALRKTALEYEQRKAAAEKEWDASSDGLEFERLRSERRTLEVLTDGVDGKLVDYRKKVSLWLLVLIFFINFFAVVLSVLSFVAFTYVIKQKRDRLEVVKMKIKELEANKMEFVRKKACNEI